MDLDISGLVKLFLSWKNLQYLSIEDTLRKVQERLLAKACKSKRMIWFEYFERGWKFVQMHANFHPWNIKIAPFWLKMGSLKEGFCKQIWFREKFQYFSEELVFRKAGGAGIGLSCATWHEFCSFDGHGAEFDCALLKNEFFWILQIILSQ